MAIVWLLAMLLQPTRTVLCFVRVAKFILLLENIKLETTI